MVLPYHGLLPSSKKECVWVHTTTCVNHKTIMLRERTQARQFILHEMQNIHRDRKQISDCLGRGDGVEGWITVGWSHVANISPTEREWK